jgi:hypothetical protein
MLLFSLVVMGQERQFAGQRRIDVPSPVKNEAKITG